MYENNIRTNSSIVSIKLWQVLTMALLLFPVAALLAAAPKIIAYPAYPGAVASPDYSVTVNGQSVFVHKHKDGITADSSMGYAHFAMSGKAKVQITYLHGQVNTCEVHPLAYQMKTKIADDTVTLELKQPRYLVIFINKRTPDNFSNEGLILFADPPEEQPVKLGDKGVVNILDSGIDNTGKTIDTAKINKAIKDIAANATGGILYFPAGIYRSGMIVMQSNVTLYLEAGALIQGCTEASEYPKISNGSGWGGACQLFFNNVEHAVIRGRGTIDCSSGSETNPGPKTYAVKSGKSRNIEIRDIILRRTREWTIHIFDTEYFHSKNVKVLNRKKGYFDDVYDLDVSRHILIEHGFTMAMDDMFALKGTPGANNGEIEDIVVRDFVAYGGDSGLALGYDLIEGSYASVKGVLLQDVHFISNPNDWAIWIGYEPGRGPYGGDYARPLENFRFVNCTFEDGGAICIAGGTAPFKNFSFENCTIYNQSKPGFYKYADPGYIHAAFAEPVRFINFTVKGKKITSVAEMRAAGIDIQSPVVFK